MTHKEARTISEVVRAAIVCDGRSSQKIARDSGISHAIISRFNARKRGLSTASLDAVCESLGLELRKKTISNTRSKADE